MTIKQSLIRLWQVITFSTGKVMFTEPGVERYFARCISCGRVFMHYWGCVTAADRDRGRRVGCKCGGLKFRMMNIPKYQQAWFMISRYVWRKLIRKEQYWDPRLVARTNPIDKAAS